MRRIGIVLVIAGAILFLVASSQRGGYDSVEGALKTTFSSSERSKMNFWDMARWVGLGIGAVGVVVAVMPGKKG